jgi:hypothetical protein
MMISVKIAEGQSQSEIRDAERSKKSKKKHQPPAVLKPLTSSCLKIMKLKPELRNGPLERMNRAKWQYVEN